MSDADALDNAASAAAPAEQQADSADLFGGIKKKKKDKKKLDLDLDLDQAESADADPDADAAAAAEDDELNVGNAHLFFHSSPHPTISLTLTFLAYHLLCSLAN